MHKLLMGYADVFSKGADHLGQTSLVKHSIITGTAPPIKQPPCRLPLALRGEAEKAVEKMQEQKRIEPSASP